MTMGKSYGAVANDANNEDGSNNKMMMIVPDDEDAHDCVE
jgi:hypothetical protein